MVSIDWENESYPNYHDFLALPFTAIFFPLIRFLLDRFVFEKVGRRLMFGKGQQNLDIETDERREKVRKFKESAWECVYFLSAEALALAVTHAEPWFMNTKNFWTGPGEQRWPEQKMKLKLKGLYMYTGGFYIYSIFALIFWETRRSDFGVSMGHHLVTVILIGLSYILRLSRVGSIILALHDATDVFLEVGKMSIYSGAKTLASFSLVLLVLTWTLLRVVYFPFWILWSTSCEAVEFFDTEVNGRIYYYVFNSLLFGLHALNIYWWMLILRMLVRQIQARDQVREDFRSGELDSESDNEHED